jgi:hypothetical protein
VPILLNWCLAVAPFHLHLVVIAESLFLIKWLSSLKKRIESADLFVDVVKQFIRVIYFGLYKSHASSFLLDL